MRIAVTGTQGQVARALTEAGARRGIKVVGLGRPALDFLNLDTIRPVIEAARPDIVVNAAAYTAVDKAESERDIAMTINGEAPGMVAKAASALNAPIIHLSTDYVFDGLLDRPYRETDLVAPSGVYGESKLVGERAVAAAHADHAILRTAWVYSPFGKNFLKTMLRLGTERNEVAVVADQLGCPTSALDMAEALLLIANAMLSRREDQLLRGVFHIAGTGEATWAQFAEAIFMEAEAFGRNAVRVRQISAADYPTAAVRPKNSRLDCSKLTERFGVTLPYWTKSIKDIVDRCVKSDCEG